MPEIDPIREQLPVLDSLLCRDKTGVSTFHAFVRSVTPTSGMRRDMQYVEILAVLEEAHFRSMWGVGDTKAQRLMEAKVKARELIESERKPGYCRGCTGTCCTGVGSDPCTCEGES